MTTTDPFAIFRDKRGTAAAIAAMILCVLLSLPAAASLGLGGGGGGGRTIVEEAFGQFNIPLPGGGGGGGGTTNEGTTAPPATTTIPQGNANEVLLRGFIGSTLPTQGGGGGGNTNTQVLTGRFRMFENESLVHRFVVEMNLAPIDGTAFHNVTIEETAPHRFEVTRTNGTTIATQTGPVPAFSSKIVTQIFVDNNPVIYNVPMTISVSGQVLTIGGISIDESRITDSGVRDILRIINGQTIYGTVSV